MARPANPKNIHRIDVSKTDEYEVLGDTEQFDSMVDELQEEGFLDVPYLTDEDLDYLEDSVAREQEDTVVTTREDVAEFLDAEPMLEFQHIDNGKDAETLKESLRHFELPGGIVGVAATSKAGYKYETDKSGEAKNRNEDRWLVDPETGLVVVADGMGGGTQGALCAQHLCEEIAHSQDDIPQAAKDTQEWIAAHPETGGSDGACFMAARLEIGKHIDMNQCGDVDLYHYSTKGAIKYQPGQQVEMGQDPQSALEYLDEYAKKGTTEEKMKQTEHIQKIVTSFAKRQMKNATKEKQEGLEDIVWRIQMGSIPVVERSNPLFNGLRAMVVRAVNEKNNKVASFQSPSPLEEGDWVLMMSDGVADNFHPEEIHRLVRHAIANDWDSETATKILSDELDRRIKLRSKKDPEAMKKHYKLDNATIVLMRAPKQNQNGLPKAA